MSLSKVDQLNKRLNIEEPRWDQTTYSGRVKHFFNITNPLNLFCSTEELNKSKDIITRYRFLFCLNALNFNKSVILIIFVSCV